MTRITRTAVVPLFLALFALGAGPAQAGAPHPRSDLIVPGKSIGGVALGQTPANAKAAWGPGFACPKPIGSAPLVCDWSSPLKSALGDSAFEALHGKVFNVQIGVGHKGDTPNFRTSITTFKTRKDIGLGSTEAALLVAYPLLKKTPLYHVTQYTLDNGKIHTRFEVEDDGRVTAILIYKDVPGA